MFNITDEIYALGESIFDGPSGTVYKVRDAESGTITAVKIIKQNRISAGREDAARFSYELDILSGISHPGVLKIFGHGQLNGDMYIASEYFGHPSLKELFRSRYVFSSRLIIDIFIQLAEALSFMHKNRIIHRYLKPSHILLQIDEKSGELCGLKIIDCAVWHIKKIFADDESRETEPFLYMSPEQTSAVSGRVDERSDLYSLGAIMYRMCSGMPPFRGDTMSDISYRKITQIPPVPSSINNAIPEILDLIIMKLIGSEADNRYHSARGVLEDLLKIRNGEKDFLLGLADKSYRLKFHTRFIGREHEIEQLKKAHHRAMSAKGGLCLIRGNAGVGKTRFVGEFCHELHTEGMFLQGKCYFFEKNNPYSPFKEAITMYHDIFSQYSSEKKQSIINRLKENLGDMGEILIRFNPCLYQAIGDSPVLAKLDPDREKKRALHALSLFFLSIAEIEGKLILFLDDLQWLDDDGFDLMREIIHNIVDYSFLIIGAYRDTEINEGHRLYRFLNKTINESHSLSLIDLLPFERGYLDQFVAELFHDSSQTITRIADLVFLRNQGNPFYAIETVRELIEKDIIYFHDRWLINNEAFEKLFKQKENIEMIVSSISLLGRSELDALSYAALSGRRFQSALLNNFGGNLKKPLSNEEIARIIDKALYIHFIEEDSSNKSCFIFTHDRIQEALIDTIDPSGKKDLHRQIAAFIMTQYNDSLEEYYYDLVYHYVSAEDEEKILEYSYLAGLKAQKTYAFDEAVMYFEQAAAMLEKRSLAGSGMWLDCMEYIGKLYLVKEDNEKSINAYRQIINFTRDSDKIVNAYKQITYAYCKDNTKYKECERTAKTGLNLLGEKLPAGTITALIYTGREFVIHLLHNIFPFFFISKNTKKNYRIDEIASFYYVLIWTYVFSDKIKFLRAVLRTLNIVEKNLGPSKSLAMGLAAYGTMLMSIPRPKLALKYLQRSLQLREVFNDTPGIAHSLYLLGLYYQWDGQFEKSLEYMHQSMNLYKRIGSSKDAATIPLIIQRIYIDTGDYEKALYYARELLAFGYAMHDHYSVASALIHHAMIYHQQGDYDQALQYLQKGYDIGVERELKNVQCSACFRFGAVYLALGDIDKSLDYLLRAQQLYKYSKPLQYYSSELFCRIAEAHIRRFDFLKDKLNYRAKRKSLHVIKKSCVKAMKIAGKWSTHRGEVFRLFAEYYALKGNNRKSRELFLTGIDYCQRLGKKYDLALAYYKYGMFRNSLNEKDAYEYLFHAYIIFSEINSAVYLSELRDILEINDKDLEPAVKNSTSLKHKEAISSFTRLIQDISKLNNRDQILERIVSVTLRLSGAQRAFLFLTGEDPDELSGIIKINSEELNKESTYIIKKIAQLAYVRQEIIDRDDVFNEGSFEEFYKIIIEIKSLLCIPIIYENSVRAVLYLDNSVSSFALSGETLQIVNAMMIHAAAAMTLHPNWSYKNYSVINDKRINYLCESSHITSKEKQVLMLLLKGYTKKQIADEYSISINTVKHHISSIYDKTGAGSREELADIFILRNNADN